MHSVNQHITWYQQGTYYLQTNILRLWLKHEQACGHVQELGGCGRLSLSSSSSCASSDVLQQRRNGSSSHGRYLGSDYGIKAAAYERQHHSRCAPLRPQALVVLLGVERSRGC